MIPYILVALFIVLLSVLVAGKKSKFGFAIVFVLLTLFAGLRGGFTSDYSAYVDLFLQANSHESLSELIKTPVYTEKGFMILMFLFGRLIDSPVAFFIFLSAVTNFTVIYVIYKQSEYPWLSILLYVGIGTYYDSFNITRFILVTAILFFCNQLIIKRKFWKFLIIVLLLMNIHRMAIIMLPMYFLLNIKITRKSMLTEVALGIVIVSLLPVFMQLMQKIFKVYANYEFGMEGGTWKTIVIPMAVAIFLLYYLVINKSATTYDITTNESRLMLNAFVYQIIFTFCSMRIYMATRIIFFFSPYLWILVPNVISQIKNTKVKFLFSFLVGILSVVYQLVVYSGTGYDPYFTIFTK